MEEPGSDDLLLEMGILDQAEMEGEAEMARQATEQAVVDGIEPEPDPGEDYPETPPEED